MHEVKQSMAELRHPKYCIFICIARRTRVEKGLSMAKYGYNMLTQVMNVNHDLLVPLPDLPWQPEQSDEGLEQAKLF